MKSIFTEKDIIYFRRQFSSQWSVVSGQSQNANNGPLATDH